MSDDLEDYIANLAKAAEENSELFVGTVKALAAAIDGKDRYTRGHSERVCRVSVAIGQRMGMMKKNSKNFVSVRFCTMSERSALTIRF